MCYIPYLLKKKKDKKKSLKAWDNEQRTAGAAGDDSGFVRPTARGF